MDVPTIFKLIICFFLIGSPLFNWRDYRKFKRRTAFTHGNVVDHKELTSTPGYSLQGNSVKTDHAIVVFKVDDKLYTCQSSSGASWTIHEKGSVVNVCYDPENPENADVMHESWYSLLMGVMIYGFPLAGIGGLIYLWVTR